MYRVLEGRVQTRVGEADASRGDYILWGLQGGRATRSQPYEVHFRTLSKCASQFELSLLGS